MERIQDSGCGVQGEQVAASSHAESKILKPEASEIGGPKGPEPTRYGDWENKGKCVDF